MVRARISWRFLRWSVGARDLDTRVSLYNKPLHQCVDTALATMKALNFSDGQCYPLWTGLSEFLLNNQKLTNWIFLMFRVYLIFAQSFLKLLQSLSEMACWTGRSDFYRLMAVSRCLGLRSILQSGTWSWPAFCLGEDFELLWLAAVLLRSAGAWRRCQRSAVSFPEPTFGCYSVVNLLYKGEPGGPLRARYPSS